MTCKRNPAPKPTECPPAPAVPKETNFTKGAIPIEYIENTMNQWKEITGYEESVEALEILIENWKIERKEE